MKPSHSLSRLGLALVLSLAFLGGCGGTFSGSKIFSTEWRDDKGRSFGAVRGRLKDVTPPASQDVAVAVAGGGNKLLGVALGGEGSPWSFAHSLDARPVLAGTVVVASGADEVFALDAATGKKLWARPTGGLPLVGAGDDGAVTAVTLSRGAGSTLLIVARDGSVRRQIETDRALGDPAVLGGLVFVPWSHQYVSAIDPTTGDEIGRVTLRDKVSRAATLGDGLYFGELAWVRFDDQIVNASSGGATRLALPKRELPGAPTLFEAGTTSLPPRATARDKNRLYARPSGARGPLGFDADRFYATYFRLAFGFDGGTGALAWVHAHDGDLVGGEAVAGGLAVCDARGTVSILDAGTGAVVGTRSFGEPIDGCMVKSDTARAPSATPTKGALVGQIRDALGTRSPSLSAAYGMLVRELAGIEDESATAALIEVASDSRSTPALVEDASRALATRRDGAPAMLAALERRYDFLNDVLVGPPVAPLAVALAAMNETKAAPLLARHLLDPASDEEALRRAAAALVTLATPNEQKPLEQFFGMYRANADAEKVAMAVASAAEALLRLDGKNGKTGRALVETAAKDAMTTADIRVRLEALLAKKAETPADKAEEKPADEAPAKPAEKK